MEAAELYSGGAGQRDRRSGAHSPAWPGSDLYRAHAHRGFKRGRPLRLPADGTSRGRPLGRSYRIGLRCRRRLFAPEADPLDVVAFAGRLGDRHGRIDLPRGPRGGLRRHWQVVGGNATTQLIVGVLLVKSLMW